MKWKRSKLFTVYTPVWASGRFTPCSQQPAIRPYPEPVLTTPHHHILFPNIHFNIILPLTPRSSKWSLPLIFSDHFLLHWEPGKLRQYSVWLQTGRLVFDRRLRQRIFPLASVSRPSLGPTQPPVKWVPGVLSLGLKRGRGVTLTTHPHLVPRSRMSRSYTSPPPKRLHGV
jgi:hypothetical protein